MRSVLRFLIGLCCLAAAVLCLAAKPTDPPVDHISKYDASIRVEAEKIGWDWRLLASIIYHESNFKPNLVNKKGAFGLMQLMPVTMNKYGIVMNNSWKALTIILQMMQKAGKKRLNQRR